MMRYTDVYTTTAIMETRRTQKSGSWLVLLTDMRRKGEGE